MRPSRCVCSFYQYKQQSDTSFPKKGLWIINATSTRQCRPFEKKTEKLHPVAEKRSIRQCFEIGYIRAWKKTELLATRYPLRQWGSVATQAVNGQGSREACPILSTKKQPKRALQEFQGMPFLISSLNKKNRYSLLPTLQRQRCPSCTYREKKTFKTCASATLFPSEVQLNW